MRATHKFAKLPFLLFLFSFADRASLSCVAFVFVFLLCSAVRRRRSPSVDPPRQRGHADAAGDRRVGKPAIRRFRASAAHYDGGQSRLQQHMLVALHFSRVAVFGLPHPSAHNTCSRVCLRPSFSVQDGNENYEPIEIIHLDADTAFTGLAFNNDGTILAISDNVSGLPYGWAL